MRNGVAVGIDLGTTSSSIAVLDDGRPTVVPNSEGAVKTPSVVAFAVNGNVLTGQPAANQAVTNAGRTFRAVKRHIGTDWTTGDIDGRTYLPQEICAQILIRLKHDAERYLDVPVTGAVITVPAFFDDAQRQATRDAARIADIEVLRLLSEPTAAALGFRLEHQETRTLVLDLGAGTCDVSLVETGDGVVEVRAISGDNHLGGDDWDQRIVDWLARRFRNAKGVDLTADPVALRRLREAAEKAKIELSVSTDATITIPYLAMDRYRNPLTLEDSLSRNEFEEITADLRDRVKAPITSALEHSDWTDKFHVLLSGSAGRMPSIQSLVRETLGDRSLSMRVAPGEIVAAGGPASGNPGRQGPQRPAPRRQPAHAGCRHRQRDDHHARPPQHHDPHEALGDLHHHRGQPVTRPLQGVPGRTRGRRREHTARHGRTGQPQTRPERRSEDRDNPGPRQQRHHARQRQRPGRRPHPVGDRDEQEQPA
ncbi:hypothetical protein GCM10029964_065520 [Kibdelosporangium lantanae]